MILWFRLISCQICDCSGTCSDASSSRPNGLVGLLYCAGGCCFSGVGSHSLYVCEHLLALHHNTFEDKYGHLHNTSLLQSELILLLYKWERGIQGMLAAGAFSNVFKGAG